MPIRLSKSEMRCREKNHRPYSAEITILFFGNCYTWARRYLNMDLLREQDLNLKFELGEKI